MDDKFFSSVCFIYLFIFRMYRMWIVLDLVHSWNETHREQNLIVLLLGRWIKQMPVNERNRS